MDRILRLGSGGLPGVGQVSLEFLFCCVFVTLFKVESQDE
jgi:hypothetical protein